MTTGKEPRERGSVDNNEVDCRKWQLNVRDKGVEGLMLGHRFRFNHFKGWKR